MIVRGVLRAMCCSWHWCKIDNNPPVLVGHMVESAELGGTQQVVGRVCVWNDSSLRSVSFIIFSDFSFFLMT